MSSKAEETLSRRCGLARSQQAAHEGERADRAQHHRRAVGRVERPVKPEPGCAFGGLALQTCRSSDPAGLTLYYFTQDEPESGKSSCEGGCAASWPPAIAVSTAVAKPDVLPGAVGTIKRSDGALQVTYGGRPLYRFAADRTPGEIKGQGVDSWSPASVELLCDCGEH